MFEASQQVFSDKVPSDALRTMLICITEHVGGNGGANTLKKFSLSGPFCEK